MDQGFMNVRMFKCGNEEVAGWEGRIEAAVLPNFGVMEGDLRFMPMPKDEIEKIAKRLELKGSKATPPQFTVEFAPKSRRGKFQKMDGTAGYKEDGNGNLYLNFYVKNKGILGGVARFNCWAFDDAKGTTQCVQEVGACVLREVDPFEGEDQSGGLN